MSPPDVLVLSNDVVLLAGFASLAREARPDLHIETATASKGGWCLPTKLLLIDPWQTHTHDRLGVLDFLPIEDLGGMPAIAALSRTHPETTVQLRLVEAGVTHLYTYSSIVVDHRRFSESLDGLLGSERLATRWELREKLHLLWHGDTRRFLLQASATPAGVWMSDRSQSDLPVSRRQVLRLRQAAMEVGGLPPPSPFRYSTVFRPAPTMPEWRAVRSFVRRLWGYNTHTNAR